MFDQIREETSRCTSPQNDASVNHYNLFIPMDNVSKHRVVALKPVITGRHVGVARYL